MRTGRPRWWVAGLSLLLVAVVALAAWLVASPTDDEQPYIVPLPEATSAGIDPAGAAQVLQRLAAAIADRDRVAAGSLTAIGDVGVRTRLEELIEVADAAVLSEVSFRYIDADGGLAADGTWAAAVAASWAYSGFDAEPTTTEVSVRFRSVDDGVVIAGVGGGNLRTPVWMSGPMQVSRTRDLLVVAAVGTDLDAYVRLARAAVPTVANVVRTWNPRLIVEVPASGSALESALGMQSGYYAQIAAVTGSGGTLSPGAPVHVFVNPDVYADLGRAGREVVLAHEATHVATDAPLSRAPIWLTEGIADYVALLRTGLPLSRTAGQIIRQVRDGGLPVGLPTAAEFDAKGPHLGAVYEASWLACVVLGARSGDGALLDFYEQMSDGANLDVALRRYFGWTETDLVEAWRSRLEELA